MSTAPRPAPARPLDERELEELQSRLDALPAPLEPLDVTMLDGYLCGVLLQPQRVPVSAWWPWVLDVDGRPLPAGHDVGPLRELVLRRHDELDDAIARRQWFDPWVYELDEDASPSETVMPWVAGFATACEHFPRLMENDSPEMLEPLALLYMHLDPEDLEDAETLIEEIETLEPPQDLPEAVEALVRSTLLIADVTRPAGAPSAARHAPRPAGGPRGGAGSRPGRPPAKGAAPRGPKGPGAAKGPRGPKR